MQQRSWGAEAMTMDKLLKKFKDERLGADLVVDAVGSVKTFEKGQELLSVGGAVSPFLTSDYLLRATQDCRDGIGT